MVIAATETELVAQFSTALIKYLDRKLPQEELVDMPLTEEAMEELGKRAAAIVAEVFKPSVYAASYQRLLTGTDEQKVACIIETHDGRFEGRIRFLEGQPDVRQVVGRYLDDIFAWLGVMEPHPWIAWRVTIGPEEP